MIMMMVVMVMIVVVMIVVIVMGVMFMMFMITIMTMIVPMMIMFPGKRCYWKQRSSNYRANQSKLVKHLRPSILPMSRSMRWGKQIGGANKTTAALSEPPLLLDLIQLTCPWCTS
jgi:hypothetical protein